MSEWNDRTQAKEMSSATPSAHLNVFTRRAGVLAAVVTTVLLALALYAWGSAAASPSAAQAQPRDSARTDADVPWQAPSETPGPQPTYEPYPGPSQEPYPGPSQEPYPGPGASPTADEAPRGGGEPKPTQGSRDTEQSESQAAAPTPTAELPQVLPKTGGGGAARR